MLRTKKTGATAAGSRGWALAAALLVTAAGALAQEKQANATKPAVSSRESERDGRDGGRRIVVSIPDCKLALIENGRVVKIFPVAVGAEVSPSPSGEFKIVHRIPQPTYYAPGKVIPPGATNPLGARWLGLNQPGYGIHGTNEPRSIGRRTSHGCIRMRNQDIEELFELVRAGDVVELHGARTSSRGFLARHKRRQLWRARRLEATASRQPLPPRQWSQQ